MNIVSIQQDDLGYPAALRTHLGDDAPESIATLGSVDILRRKMLAFFCSVKCPGNLILQTYNLAQSLRSVGVTVIGGFHSPLENECLTMLLRGPSPVIICPARSITGMRVPAEYKEPLAEGRLLLFSPFAEKLHRATAQTALYRNRFVAALADQIFVAYAEPLGKTEQLCRDVLAWRKPLYTLDGDANASLITLGAQPVTPDGALKWLCSGYLPSQPG